jgi:hypothetical protein
MNAPNMTEDKAANATDALLRPQNARTDPTKEAIMVATAKYMNKLQPIIFSAL